MSTPNVKQDGSTIFVEYDGGVTEETVKSNPEAWRSGSIEVGSDGSVRDLGAITHNTIDTPSGIDTGELMSTVRGEQGQNISDHSQITDECSIEIGGMRTTVGNALRLGYITRDSQGNFYDSKSPQPEPVKREASKPVPFDPQMSAHLDALKSIHGADVIDGVMARAIGDLAQGKDADGAVRDLANTIGMEERDGYAVANGILRRLQDSMFGMVERFGEDGDAVADWFHSSLSPDMRSHFLVRVYHGDATALKDMIGIYKRGDHY